MVFPKEQEGAANADLSYEPREAEGHNTIPTSNMLLLEICKLMIRYKGYIGHFSFDERNNIFYGKAANTHDVITFQGKSIKETQEAFRDAVDEHLEWCKKYGKKPDKPFSLDE